MNNYKSGYLAEKIVRWFLFFKGYSLLKKNYKTGKGTHAGEVDLIVKKGSLVVFVEVKKRATIDKAGEAISAQQKQRISKGAEAFMQKHKKYQNCDLRFDAVLVSFPFQIEHIKNAW